MDSYKTLGPFLRKHKWNYLFGIFWLLVVDTAQLFVPQIIRNLANDYQNHALNMSSIIKYALLIMGSGLFVALGRYLWRIYIMGTSRTLEYYLRSKLFNHLLSLSPNFFNKNKTGDLMAHATNDVNAVRMSVGQGIMMLVDSIFMIIFTLFAMTKTANLKLTLIALLTLPFIIIIVNRFGKIIHRRFRMVQSCFANLTDTTQESFSGIRVIKSFVQEDLVLDNFTRVNQENFDKNLDLVKISGTYRPLITFISSISFLLIIFIGAKEVILNRIELGDFIAFNSYLGLLTWPMMALGMVINLHQRGAASMERLNAILNEKSEIIETDNPVPLEVKGKIEFKDVTFKYRTANVNALENINLTLEAGNTLAIVGRTGSGKTTLISLLLRLYDIDEGNIFIDDVDIKELDLKTLRESIGYVPQDNFLFSKSIADNISFAFDHQISLELVHQAAKDAQIYDNIVDFPNHFETILGERGVTLSGGQKQRTSIARALIKKPPILILDDSLSAVDTETEEQILNNLEELMDDQTTIIISHRISTVKDADEIIFLEDGQIMERGTHEELLNLKGQYWDLHEKQLLEEKLTRG